MGHFARECTQDVNPTKAIGKLHHTLEAETPIPKSLLTEFFNKLMRVQRKHDIVQAKLKKARQQGAGGTMGPATPSTKAPPPAGKAGGTPPKGEKRAPPRRSVRFQNQKGAKAGTAAGKGDNRPATPPTPRKDSVNEVQDTDDPPDTDYGTDDLASLPTDSDPEDYGGTPDTDLESEGNAQ